jgi:Tfp pilus assembly protein PilF
MMLPMLVLATLALGQEPAPAPPAPQPQAAPSNASAAQSDIQEGLDAFRRLHFTRAEASFRKATEEDPTNAAAAWYLAYTVYKIVEPKRPFHPDKQKSAELFAKAYALDPNFQPVWGSGHRTPPPPPKN